MSVLGGAFYISPMHEVVPDSPAPSSRSSEHRSDPFRHASFRDASRSKGGSFFSSFGESPPLTGARTGRGDVRWRNTTARVECTFKPDGGVPALEFRVLNERLSLDVWRRIDEDEFRDVAGVSCSLERFAEEVFRLLDPQTRDQTKLLEIVEENGRCGFALVHVDGAWQTEECVIPLEPTPTKVRLADVWAQLHERRSRVSALEARIGARKSELARVCPESASLVALKESVEFWRRKGSEEVPVEVRECGPLEAKAANVKGQLSELGKRKDGAGRKVKALEELARNLSAACSALIAEKKQLKDELNVLKNASVGSPGGAEDSRLAVLRAKADQLRADVASISDSVRSKKRLIQVTLSHELRAKTRALSIKKESVANLRAAVDKREKAATAIARDLVAANSELQQWIQRRQGLLWLEQWLAAKDSRATIAIKADVPRLEDLLEQVPAELGEKCALATRLRNQLSQCRDLLRVISCSKPVNDG